MANPELRGVGECGDMAMPSCSGSTCSSQVERMPPDLLKNTPSNIARLEDIIEHCKSRQKYHAHTKSPSDGDDVRWYFSKVPLSEKDLAASLPPREIIGKDDYFRFSMRDSLALEVSFLQEEEELLAYWWKEYAECSKGPSGPGTSDSGVRSDDPYVVEEERVGLPVKGGLFEVDLHKRHCFPVYWSGENRRVLRGHWFARKVGRDWLPLREDISEQLELAYRCQVWRRRKFQSSGLFASRIDLQGTKEGLHAFFTGDDDSWEAWLAFDSSGFPINIGGGNCVKLRRGFSPSGSPKLSQDEQRQKKEEEMDDYCSQVPVGHLVFMVHGIGQRLEKASLIDDVADFRQITANLAASHLTAHQRSTQRVLFVPCQWRRGLELNGETTIEKITLHGVRGLRATLSATVHDVLYYMSPIYCQDIIDSVTSQLNRQYAKFLKRNPGYSGKVSIFGHSLGSVLTYDVLCNQESSASVAIKSCFMDAFQISKQECVVDIAQQPSKFHGNTIYYSNHSKDGVASKPAVSVKGSSTSNPQDKTGEISCNNDHVFIRDQQESFLDNGKVQFQVLDDSGKLLCEMRHSVSAMEQVDEVNKNIISETLHSIDKDHDVNPDIRSYFQVDALKDTRCIYGDAIDKDKLIFLLMEEVKSLKEKVAEQQKSSSCFLNSDDGSCLDVCQQEDQMTKSPTNSFPGKFSSAQDDNVKRYTPYIKYSRLDFKVDTFFAVGSPLGVFLSLRNVRIGDGRGHSYWEDEKISEEMPSCRRMFNIFHPFDPVAYRVEPLICKDYTSKSAALIPYHKGGKRLHVGLQEFTEDITTRSQTIMNQINTLRVKVAATLHLQNKDEKKTVEEIKQRSYGSFMMEKLTGSEGGRVDYALQEDTFQHPYLSAIASHTNYWRDKDTALFVLNHLFRNVPEEPHIEKNPDSGRMLK